MSTQPIAKSNTGAMILAALIGLLGVLIVAGSVSNHAETTRWLSRQRAQAVTIDPSYVDPKNEGKLVHVVGSISSEPREYHDPAFDVRGQGLAMVRQTLLCRQFGDRLVPERRDLGTPFFQLVLGQADRDEIFAGAYQIALRDSFLLGAFGVVVTLASAGVFVRRWWVSWLSADR